MKHLNIKCLIALFLLFGLISCKENRAIESVNLEGTAFGTSFHITYFDKEHRDVTKSIDSLFYLINKSLSTYIKNSDISKINSGDQSVIVDDYFIEVFQKSLRIYRETNGVFDPTIGVLVNVWGFGPEKPTQTLDTIKIKKLLNLVGFDKVHLRNGRISKTNDSIYLDFNAIAKGYAVDVAGRFLESKNINNYLVEIGGEIRSRGINKNKNSLWKVGIENPNFDGTRSFDKVITLSNEAMATSGSYRKFKLDSISGEKYTHILNAKTGMPMQSNLLSVSIISSIDCADVDGYATALMAMSLMDAKVFLKEHDSLKGFLIYSTEAGELNTFSTTNF